LHAESHKRGAAGAAIFIAARPVVAATNHFAGYRVNKTEDVVASLLAAVH